MKLKNLRASLFGFPGGTVEDIQALVERDLKIADNVVQVEPPTEEQISIMRSFDPMGFILGTKTVSGPESFDKFCDRVTKGYQAIPLDLDD